MYFGGFMSKREFSTGLATISLCLIALMTPAQAGPDPLDACIEDGFSELISENSRTFKSAQYGLVCDISQIDADSKQCVRDEKADVFSFVAPVGFTIDEARFKPIMKSVYATISAVQVEDTLATISLSCTGRPCEISGHEMVRGSIVGKLLYVPTVDDAKAIARHCVTENTKR